MEDLCYEMSTDCEEKDIKLLLLRNLRNIVERLLSDACCNTFECTSGHPGIVCLAEMLENIFTHQLRAKDKHLRTVKFPGFLLLLQWCLNYLDDGNYQRFVLEELKLDLFQSSDFKDKSETDVIVGILLCDMPLVAIISLLEDNTVFADYYRSTAFMNDGFCLFSLVTCLRAFHQKTSISLSQISLTALEHNLNIMFSLPCLAGCIDPLPIVVGRWHGKLSVLRGECKDAQLPDVVACTRPNSDGPYGIAPCQSFSSRPSVDSVFEEVKDSDTDFSTMSVEDSQLHSYNGHSNHPDCLPENVQLHLSELVIAVIQGQKCGLSSPDLLLECANKAPEMVTVGSTQKASLTHNVFPLEKYLNIDSLTYRNQTADDPAEECMDGNVDHLTSDLEWCISPEEVPQQLLPLPGHAPPEAILDPMLRTPRNSMEYVTLHTQFSTIHHSQSKRNGLVGQKYKCAGCGMCATRSYNNFNYCEFLGAYFCDDCHDSSTKRVIPSRILQNFDFKLYKVSKVGCMVLDEIFSEPIFNIDDINPHLYQKSKTLLLCRDLRKKGTKLLKNIESCPLVWEHHSTGVHALLDKLPVHILRSQPSVYSLCDLVNIKSGWLYKQLNNFVTECLTHLESCDFCTI